MQNHNETESVEDIAETDQNKLDTSPEGLIEDLEEATLQTQISELETKILELKDQYVRAQAEMLNQQKRYQDEIKKARDYAISNFAKDIVVVKDYLEMALLDQSGNFEAIKTGVDLTLKQLLQIFERQLIKEISPSAKDKLDPHLHQAVNTLEAEGQESNTIVSVMQKGYMLNERVLRPAMVAVAK